MQIILMEKVANLGNLGDVVKVKDGYARNYLIPSGRAKRATAQNKQYFEERRAELERIHAEKLAAAGDLSAKLQGVTLTIARRASVDGRLFGSVSPLDIAEELAKQGITVERSAIRMPAGAVKSVSENHIDIALHSDVAVSITVHVVAEG